MFKMSVAEENKGHKKMLEKRHVHLFKRYNKQFHKRNTRKICEIRHGGGDLWTPGEVLSAANPWKALSDVATASYFPKITCVNKQSTSHGCVHLIDLTLIQMVR